MSGRLQDKVAIITGATSGIGEATARRFVAEGARVVLAGRTVEKGEALARELGPNAVFQAADVMREGDIAALVDTAVARFGRLDCLFNNAGGPAPTGSIASVPVDGFDQAMALLVRSVMLGMKHAAPVMMKQRSGAIEYNYRRIDTTPILENPGPGVTEFAAMSGTDPATYVREEPGMSAFALEDGIVYHTYSTYARGLDGLWGMYQWLDRAPKGRNETGVWWRRHDEYGQPQSAGSCCH